jgi:dienelactone hydrolase
MVYARIGIVALLVLGLGQPVLYAEDAPKAAQSDKPASPPKPEDLTVPFGNGTEKPEAMMRRYFLKQVERAADNWKKHYETLQTPEQITTYQKLLREKLLTALGGFPERTPLLAKTTGVISRPGYRVEKVLFQSQPNHYVSALLFVPDSKNFQPPYPGVIVPCGHAPEAKAYESYQTMGALLALNGMVGLVFDPIDQGERGQYFGKGGWPELQCTAAHTMVGISSILLGQNTARFEIWDGMRAIDYLQSRPEIDPKRIGCTGNSGGGTQTSYLFALDDRIQAAAPSCFITSLPRLLNTIGPQDAEQNIFGQLAIGIDHADYLMLRAPTPVLVCAATKDFFDITGTWDSFRSAKRLFTRLGYAERVDILENCVGHNYNTTQREGVVRWLSRWLLGKDRAITEPKITLLTQQECHCTPDGKVMAIPGARSVYDLNEDYENFLAQKRAESWETGDLQTRLNDVRCLAGVRTLDAMPKLQAKSLGTVDRKTYRIEKLLLQPETDVSLPALLFLPEKVDPNRVVLYLHNQGKTADAAPGGAIEKRVLAGDTVLAVDLRGIGQTQPSGKHNGYFAEYQDAAMAYLLGRCYVGMQAEDVLACTRYLSDRLNNGQPAGVQLVAIGNVGISALHAAALEPSLFRKITLNNCLVSWANVLHSRLHQGVTTHWVNGALLAYDLPDLIRSLGKKIEVVQPINAMGKPLAK